MTHTPTTTQHTHTLGRTLKLTAGCPRCHELARYEYQRISFAPTARDIARFYEAVNFMDQEGLE